MEERVKEEEDERKENTVHYKHPCQMAICDAKYVNLQSAD